MLMFISLCIAQSTGTHPGLFLALTRAKFETSFTKVYRLIRYVKILTRLRGFRVKTANFSRLHCLAIPRRDLSTKKTKPNIEKSQPQPQHRIIWKFNFFKSAVKFLSYFSLTFGADMLIIKANATVF